MSMPSSEIVCIYGNIHIYIYIFMCIYVYEKLFSEPQPTNLRLTFDTHFGGMALIASSKRVLHLYLHHIKLVLTTFVRIGSNCVWTSWTSYKLPGWAKTFLDGPRMPRTLNLLKMFCRPSCSEPVWKNIVRTTVV